MIYFAPITLFLCLLIVRWVAYKKLIKNGFPNTSKIADPNTQFFYFLKALTQKSLCSREYEPEFKNASSYYPLGLYWLTTNLALRKLKVERSPVTYNDLKSQNHYSSLSLKYCLRINILILPLMSSILVGILPYILIDNVIISTFLSIFCMIYVDLYLPNTEYPIQGRTIGYYCSIFTAFCIAIFIRYDTNPFYFNYNILTTYILKSDLLLVITSIIIPIISLLTLSSLLFIVFRCSQQGSQLIISLLFSASFVLGKEYYIPFLIALLIAINTPLYDPSLASMNYYSSHLLNRINESSWFLRTYGVQKYKFFNFKSKFIKPMLKSIIGHDVDPRNGINHGRYKQSWLSQLIENRSIIYCLTILYFGTIDAFRDDILLSFNLNQLLIIFAWGALIPSLICCSRLMQGYGPPLHYIDFYTPFCWITIGSFLYLHQINTAFTIFISLDFLCYLISLLRSYIIETQKLFKANYSEEPLDNTSLVDKFICDNEKSLILYCHRLLLKTDEITNTRVAVVEGHYQMILEVSCLLASNIYSDHRRNKIRKTIAFPLIDSKTYSFYNHWIFIYTTVQSIINAKVTHLFYDQNSQMQLSYVNKISKLGPSKVLKLGSNLSLMKVYIK